MKTAEQILHLAMHHERMAKELRKQVEAAEQYAMFPPDHRLVYSATERCNCGLGLAYDAVQDFDWSCSALLLGKAKDGKHKKDMPHCLYHIAVENGQTTRPKC